MLRLRKVSIQDGDLAIIQTLDPRAILGSLEQDWLVLAVYWLKRHRQFWIVVRVERLARPSEHVSIHGDLGDSPIALALVELAQRGVLDADLDARDLKGLATRTVAAAAVSRFIECPELLSLAGDVSVVLEAGRGLRQLDRLTDEMSKLVQGARTPDETIAVLQQISDTVDPNDARPNVLLRRYLGALARLLRGEVLVETSLVEHPAVESDSTPTRVAAPIIEPRPLAAAAFLVPEAVDEERERRRPQETAHSPGSSDPDAVPEAPSTVVFPRSLPGSDRVGGGSIRRVLDEMEVRAARAEATGIATGRLESVPPAAVRGLRPALELATKRPETRGGAALVLAGLYAGLAPVTCANVPIWSSETDVSTTAYFCRKPLGLFVPVRAADRLPAAPAECVGYVRQPRGTLFIPLSDSIAGGRSLVAWLESRADGSRFADANDVHAARDLLHGCAQTQGNPITPRRLPGIFNEALAGAGVGELERALILGRRAGGDTQSGLHYFAPTRARMAALAWRGVRAVSEWLGTSVTPDSPAVSIEGYVGCRRHPTDEAIRQWMIDLGTVNTARPVGRPTDEAIRAHHVRFQSVFFEVASWALGVRPWPGALDGLLHADDWVQVDEKKKPGARKKSACRLVPVPRSFSETWLEAWRAHRRKVRRHFSFPVEPPAFFSITYDGRATPATSETLQSSLPMSCLVDNACRSTYRTGLEAAGVSHAALQRWVGHWSLGFEPGAPGSGSAMKECSAADLDALETYFTSLGLPLPGVTRRGR